MHSSRMRTVRSISRLLRGGCLLPGGGGVCLGGVCSWGMPAPGGWVPPLGEEEVPALGGGCLLPGVPALGGGCFQGGYPSMH